MRLAASSKSFISGVMLDRSGVSVANFSKRVCSDAHSDLTSSGAVSSMLLTVATKRVAAALSSSEAPACAHCVPAALRAAQ